MSDQAIKLINSVTSLSNVAMKMVLQYLTTPAVAGVMIFCESIEKSQPSDISKQVIIDGSGKRKSVSDNFNILPLQWKLKGYLKAADYEMSSYFQPSLQRQLSKLETARKTGAEVDFKDKNNKKFKVGIANMRTKESAEVQNAIPIELDLDEVEIQTTTTALVDKAEANGYGTQGSENGSETNEGTQQPESKNPDPGSQGFQLIYGK